MSGLTPLWVTLFVVIFPVWLPVEMSGNQYFFNAHGRHVPTDHPGYLTGLRYQMRILTRHPMVFFGVAALTMYGRRGRRGGGTVPLT